MAQDAEKRYPTNPFLNDLVIHKRDKLLKISSLGKENSVLINQSTGEITGTHVMAVKKVDTQQFLKLFTQNIALTFDLTTAGIKALNIVMWIIQNEALNKDLITISKWHIDDFNKQNDKDVSLRTFYRGLKELEKNKIIAKYIANSQYFINPNFVFNGDRIAFTTLIEKKKQATLFDDLEQKAEDLGDF